MFDQRLGKSGHRSRRSEHSAYPHQMISDVLDGAAFLELFNIREWSTCRALHRLEFHEMSGVVVKLRIYEHRLTDSAVANGFPHSAHRVAVEIARSARKNQSASLRERKPLAGQVKVGGERLFGINVLARFQSMFDRVVVGLNAC